MCCSRYCYYNCAYFLCLFQKKILIILCLVILLVILVIIIGSALGVTLWRPQHAKPNAEQPIVCLATPTQPASRSQLRLVDSLSRVRAHVRDGNKNKSAQMCAAKNTHTVVHCVCHHVPFLYASSQWRCMRAARYRVAFGSSQQDIVVTSRRHLQHDADFEHAFR